MAAPIFDFSRVPLIAEDVVVRTIDADDPERSVDVLVTPSGRRALWNWTGFDDPREAVKWLTTTA